MCSSRCGVQGGVLLQLTILCIYRTLTLMVPFSMTAHGHNTHKPAHRPYASQRYAYPRVQDKDQTETRARPPAPRPSHPRPHTTLQTAPTTTRPPVRRTASTDPQCPTQPVHVTHLCDPARSTDYPFAHVTARASPHRLSALPLLSPWLESSAPSPESHRLSALPLLSPLAGVECPSFPNTAYMVSQYSQLLTVVDHSYHIVFRLLLDQCAS